MFLKWQMAKMGRINFCALLMLLVFLGLGTYQAKASDLNSVSGIEVDITAASATEARDTAILEAQRTAFERLYSRIVVGNRAAWPPSLTASQLSGLVQSFEVVNEHSSAVRYMGEFTVNFNEDSLRDFMSGRSLRVVEYASAPLVVLPLYGSGNRWILWDTPNPWREAWLDAAIDNPLVPLIQPTGDLSDISTLSVRNAAVRDHASLRRLMLRYDAGGALLVIAEAEGESYAAPSAVNLLVIRHEANGEQEDFRLSVSALENEAPAAFFERVMQSVIAQINDNWKVSTAIDTRVENGHIVVYSQISTLRNWVEIQNRLNNVRLVSAVMVETLSRNEVRYSLDYRGDEDQLRAALAQAGLGLTSNIVNSYAPVNNPYLEGGGVVMPSGVENSTVYTPPTTYTAPTVATQIRRFEISIL